MRSTSSRLLVLLAASYLMTCYCLAQAVPALADADCDSFSFARESQEGIRQRYLGVVLRVGLFDGADNLIGEGGSGVLIDPARGIALTARHVIEPALQQGASGLRIMLQSPSHSEKWFAANFAPNPILDEPSRDLAALQVQDPSLVKGWPRVEVSLKKIDPNDPHFLFGFPRDELAASIEQANPVKHDETTFYGRWTTFKGDSGAPIFDIYGRVVGIVVKKAGNVFEDGAGGKGYFRPLNLVASGLDNFLSEDFAKSLFDQFVRLTSDQEFSARLVPSQGADVLSNLEFARLIDYMVTGDWTNTQLSRRIKCPFVEAATERGIDIDRIIRLSQLALSTPLEQGRTYGRLFESTRRRDLQAAHSYFELAGYWYTHGVQSVVSRDGSALFSAFCVGGKVTGSARAVLLSLGIDPAASTGSESCNTSYENEFLATALKEQSDLYLKASVAFAQDRESNALNVRAAMLSAVAAVAVTAKDETAGAAYANIGKVLFDSGYFGTSSAAYAAAINHRYSPDWVQDGFVSANRRSLNTSAAIDYNDALAMSAPLSTADALSGVAGLAPQ